MWTTCYTSHFLAPTLYLVETALIAVTQIVTAAAVNMTQGRDWMCYSVALNAVRNSISPGNPAPRSRSGVNIGEPPPPVFDKTA